MENSRQRLSRVVQGPMEFHDRLRRHLQDHHDRILLRIQVNRSDPGPAELTGADILQRGEKLARRYCSAPERGVVLLLLPHSVELFLLHFGLILANRLPAILAWPTSRVDPEKYQRNLLHQLRNLPAAELLTLPQLAGNLDAGLPYLVSSCPLPGAEEMERSFRVPLTVEPAAKRPGPPPAGASPSDALFLQFSGGTTGAQKCVVITAPMLIRQLERLRETLDCGPEDGVASWLPLYHDMGLIGCLWFPLWIGAPSYQCSAGDWLLQPDLLFHGLDRYKGAFCWLPNFAFSYLAGARGRMKGPYDLRRVKGFINCSEPVRLRSMRSFAETFADWGVSEAQAQASYAMAENVFAVTQTVLGVPPPTFPRGQLRQRTVEFNQLAYDLLDDVYVSSGPVLAGMQVRIRHADGTECGEGEPGGIEILTESLFSGYWGNDGFQTHAFTADGWYATGDYGFMNQGELFVIGRMKDIVIVGGQNVFPEDAEAVANAVAGVYPGRVVAFGVEDAEQGTESLVVVAEMRGEYEAGAAAGIQREIQRLVLSALGIAPRYVKVAPERWIVKSTAGKISRKETRLRFLAERRGAR